MDSGYSVRVSVSNLLGNSSSLVVNVGMLECNTIICTITQLFIAFNSTSFSIVFIHNATGKTNELVMVNIDTTRNLANCTFGNSFQPSVLTIAYGVNGSDEKYRDNATDPANGIITLSVPLKSGVSYSYTLTAQNGTQCVKVVGFFQTGDYIRNIVTKTIVIHNSIIFC